MPKSILCIVLAGILGWSQSLSADDFKTVAFTMKSRLIPGKGTKRATFTTLIPGTLPGIQTVRDVKYSPKPSKLLHQQGNTYAIFIFESPAEPQEINIEVTLDIFRHDFETMRDAGTESKLSEIEAKRWLRSETYIESDAQAIRDAASEVEGTDRLEEVRRIMQFVTSTLKYGGYTVEQQGAEKALVSKEGDCTEFSDLFVALCRAKGIPARNCDGLLAVNAGPNDTSWHKWAEFYLEPHGWIAVDPLKVELGLASFGWLPNQYVYFTRLRNDPVLEDYELQFYRYVGEAIEYEGEVKFHEPGHEPPSGQPVQPLKTLGIKASIDDSATDK